MSNLASDIELHAGLRMVPRNVGAGDLVGGLLTLSMTSEEVAERASPLLLLDNGLTLSGVSIVSGDPAVDLTALSGGQLLTMYCPTGSATLEHNGAVAPEYRFDVFPSSSDLTVIRSLTQFVYDQGAQRWFPTDWGAWSGSSASFATDPGSTVVAIERIAAALSLILLGPIPDL